MSDHERLAALRRITVKRGATKAEAATAKRLADELEAKIGKKPRTRRLTGHKLIRQEQILTVFLIKYGVLSTLTVLAGIILGPIVFARWWIRTWRGERLRPALIFLIEHVPGFAIMAGGIGLDAYLEDRCKWPTLLAFAATFAVMFAIGIPWWRWICPEIQGALRRARNSALRAGVAVIAIAVIALVARGVWAYV